MKSIIIALFLLALFSNSYAQSISSGLHINEELEVHNGTPRQIRETITFYKSKGGTEKQTTKTEYDQSGLPTRKINIDETNEVTSIQNFRYDTVNRVILESFTDQLKFKFPTRKVRRKYFYEGNEKRPRKIQELDLRYNIVCEIILINDVQGFPIELRGYEPVGNLYGIEIASYNYQKNQAFVSVLDNSGKPISTDTMKISFKDAYKFKEPDEEFNENNDLVSYSSTWFDGSIHYTEMEYIYDQKKNWIIKKRYEVNYSKKGKKKSVLKAIEEREIVYWD